MSETAEVSTIESVASGTNEAGGSQSATASESKELPEANGIPSTDKVPVKGDAPQIEPQTEPVTNTESTIESQDESLATEPGAAEESGPHKTRRRIKGVLNRLQDQVKVHTERAESQDGQLGTCLPYHSH